MELMLGFLLAMSVTMALIPPLMHVAARFHIVDAPSERKVHGTPVPRVGGIAMAAGTLLALSLSGPFAQPMPAYIAGVVVLLLFGIWDDRVTLSAGSKLVGQAIAAVLVMTWGDVQISTLTLTERHAVADWIALPLTFAFIVGVTNAINLADGLDGLAGGTTLLSLCALALLALTSGSPFVGVVAIVIIGAILGFLRFNTHPARVFMGDSGSQILGFSAGVLAVVLTQDPATPLSSALPLLLLGIPIIDTLMVMTQRILSGRSPFHADRNHIHHRLLALGFDHHEAVMIIYVSQGLLFLLAWFFRYESDLSILIGFAAFALLTLSLLQAALMRQWRWRAVRTGDGVSASRIGRAVEWLRRPEHLPRWALIAIAVTVAAYFAAVGWVCPPPSTDVRIMMGLLGLCIVITLAARWHEAEASWLDKGALYVAGVVAVYFDRQTTTVLEAAGSTQWLLFGLLGLAIALRFRYASDRRFRITPLDVLIIFVAVAVPNLPGSVASSAILGEGIAKLMLLMYGIETLLGAASRWWRVPSLVALLFVMTGTVRDLF